MVSEVEVLKGHGVVKNLCSVFLFKSNEIIIKICIKISVAYVNIWYYLICMYRKYRHSWFYFNIILCACCLEYLLLMLVIAVAVTSHRHPCTTYRSGEVWTVEPHQHKI